MSEKVALIVIFAVYLILNTIELLKDIKQYSHSVIIILDIVFEIVLIVCPILFIIGIL